MEDYQKATTTHKTPHPRIGFMYIIPLGIILGFILFTISFFATRGEATLASITSMIQQKSVSPTDPPQLTAQATSVPTLSKPSPTAMPESIAKDALQIRVLNGSGVAGAAGKVAAVLKAAGYTEVSADNADGFDYEDVTIRYTKQASGSVPELEEVLEKSYTVSETEEAELDDDVSIEIIIGKAS